MRKNMKKSRFAFPLIALVVCLVIVTGSTFSLFTSETGANIAITSGTVDMTAKIDSNLHLYSKGVKQDGLVFANGGTAGIITGEDGYPLLNIEKITPGDSIEFSITITNKSNVKTAYRITWTSEKNTFADLGVYIKGESDELVAMNYGVSQWTYLEALEEDETEDITIKLVIDLPIEAGNDNQAQSAKISFAVEGVQANGTAEYDDTAYVSDDKGLQAAINAGATEIILNNDIVIDSPIEIGADVGAAATFSTKFSGVVIDLNGNTLTAGAGVSSSANCAFIVNKGNVKIINGTIKVENATAIRNMGATANLILEEMTIVQTGSEVPSEWLASAVFTSNGATTVINSGNYSGVSSAVIVATSGGNLTINGGTFTAEKTAARVDSWSYNSILTINDGIFNSANKALFADGYKYVTINGGVFNATIDSTYTNIDIKGGTFTVSIKQPGGHQNKYAISGGNFVEDVSKYVIDGHKSVETDEGWVVIGIDYDYVADGVLISKDGKTYYVSNAAGYAWVDAQSDDFFSGKTVALSADIDFGGATINSIRFWNPESKVVIDGQNHTLSNFVIKATNAGLFSGVIDVKNLIVDNATVSGTYAGAIAGNMYGNVENCIVKNSTITSTYWQSGGLVGQYNSGNVTGCTVENCTISGGSAVGGLIGILNESKGVRKVEGCTVKNCKIEMTTGFGGVYDTFFSAGVGLINISNSKIYFANNTVTDTIVKGVASDALYSSDEGNTIFIDGMQLVNKPIVVAAAPLAEDFLFPAGTNAVVYKDMIMTGDAQIEHTDNAVLGLSNVKADLDHDVIIRKSAGAIVISDCDFTLADGAMLISVGEGGDAYQVFLINVKVNGEVLTQESAAQYLEGISWYQALPAWPEM